MHTYFKIYKMRRLLYCWLLLLVHPLYGQFEREKNIVMPLSNPDFHYGVTPIDERGVVLFHETENLNNQSKRRWEVIVLDSGLNYRWNSTFESDMNYVISSIKSTSDYVYLMFQDTNIPLKDVFFVRFKLDQGKFEFFQINALLPKEIIGFEVLGNSLFIIGTNDDRPAILKYVYGDLRPEVLQGLYEEENEILQSSVNEKLGFVQIITRMEQKGRESVLLLKQFDEFGDLSKDILIKSPKGYHMRNAVAHTDNNGNTTILGAFSYKKSNFSNGVFSTVFSEDQQNKLYYYNYANLHNYFNYLEDPIDIENTKQKFKTGKSARSVKINHIPRMLMKNDDHLVFVGEVVRISEKYSNAYGFLWQQDYIDYSHSIALGLDEYGKIKWDHTISLKDQTSLTSYQQTYLKNHNDGIILFYSDNYNIHYKVIDELNSEFNKDQISVSSYKIEDKQENEVKYGNILHWYDDTYLMFGETSWLNDSQLTNSSFYLNKISLNLRSIQ